MIYMMKVLIGRLSGRTQPDQKRLVEGLIAVGSLFSIIRFADFCEVILVAFYWGEGCYSKLG